MQPISEMITVSKVDDITVRAKLKDVHVDVTHGIQLAGGAVRLTAKQKLFNEIATSVLSEIDVPEEHDDWGFCSVTCNSMQEGVIIGNPETIKKLQYFLEKAYSMRIHGDEFDDFKFLKDLQEDTYDR